MFTGIIEEVGAVVEVNDSGGVRRLRVRSPRVVRDAEVGSSIAVNGVCLTAVAIDESGFTAELVQETLKRSSLKNIEVGSLVNLERPMRANGRFDGHIVQGHVDGTGRIAEFSQNGDDRTLDIEFPASAGRYLVEKGSIAVDGISLTIAAVQDRIFRVAIIPHTVENTNLQRARAGDLVNLEFDVIAKYVERMLKP
jgi:riboflavin synthase